MALSYAGASFAAAQAWSSAAHGGGHHCLVLAFHGVVVDLHFCFALVYAVDQADRSVRSTRETEDNMADVAVQHGAVEIYEPSLFGTYSKKIGMWLFLLSDTLDLRRSAVCLQLRTHFHAGLAHAVWQGEHLQRDHHDGLPALQFADHGAGGAGGDGAAIVVWTRNWMLFTMLFGAAFIVLHALEWSHLIDEGMTPFKNPWAANVPQFGGTFFTLTGMHMLHVTIGVIYLGVVSLRKKFLPILLAIWGWPPGGYPGGQRVSLRRPRAVDRGDCLGGDPVPKPKDYDAHDVEIAGLYWHFVDLVWMFIFPLVYLMSTRVV